MNDTIPFSAIERALPFNPNRGCFVEADTGPLFPIEAMTEVGPIVRSKGTGVFGRVVKTSEKVSREGLVRVRIDFAQDTGDAEGTLIFGQGAAVGGYANYRLFQGLGW